MRIKLLTRQVSKKQKRMVFWIVIGFVILFCVIFGLKRYNYCSPAETGWITQIPIAHRGLFSNVIEENSIGAFKNAILKGYAIELDLRHTQDNIPMVIHDNNLKRLTGHDVRLSDLSMAEAKQLTLQKTGEKIPTLDEVLEIVDGQVPLLIEIKAFHLVGAFEEAVVDVLKDYHGEYAIQSFNPFVCRLFKKRIPELTVGLLLDDISGFHIRFFRNIKDNLFTMVSSPNFISYNYHLLEDNMLDLYRDAGIPVIGYTLDGSYIGSNKYQSKVDNIIFEDM